MFKILIKTFPAKLRTFLEKVFLGQQSIPSDCCAAERWYNNFLVTGEGIRNLRLCTSRIQIFSLYGFSFLI